MATTIYVVDTPLKGLIEQNICNVNVNYCEFDAF
jgi:hypothetical protein